MGSDSRLLIRKKKTCAKIFFQSNLFLSLKTFVALLDRCVLKSSLFNFEKSNINTLHLFFINQFLKDDDDDDDDDVVGCDVGAHFVNVDVVDVVDAFG